METNTHHASSAESQNAGQPEQVQQGQEQEFSQEEEKQFRLLVDDLFDSYDPQSALEEAAVITIARALWLKRNHLEFNSDTRQLDQEISTALTHLYKSKSIRKAHEWRRRATGIMSNIHRKDPHWGLIRRPVGPQGRAQPLRSKVALQLLTPPTGGHGLGNGLSPADTTDPEEVKERARDRYHALATKRIAKGLTPDEEVEFEAVQKALWNPERIEDHPLYESIVAWRKVAESGREEAAAQGRRRFGRE
jgi:hypothetical protein